MITEEMIDEFNECKDSIQHFAEKYILVRDTQLG